jgi:hypothetical protein
MEQPLDLLQAPGYGMVRYEPPAIQEILEPHF